MPVPETQKNKENRLRRPKLLRAAIQTRIGLGQVGNLSHRAPNGLCEDLVCALELRSTQLEQKTEELHRTKLRLKEISDLYGQLIELAPIGLVTLDERTRICEINDAMAKLLLRDKFSPIGEAFTMY